jgi:cyclophilin family peptidyl-prolyl cis-trans isomerase
MSDRTALHDYGNSRAVLIGTSTYRNLGNVPAARSLQRMHDLLASDLCGWPADKITEIKDELRPGDLHSRLIKIFRDVTDVALFYFVGHGLIDDEDQLCLGLVESSTELHLRASTSLQFRNVRDAFIHSRAEVRVLILDCCFSGLASQRKNSLGASDLADQAGVVGVYTMAACQAYGKASFDAGGPDPQTYFTKFLVDLIEKGMPGQPAELRLRPIFQRLAERLTEAGHPKPVERNIDSASQFVFAYNAAPVQVQVDVATAIQKMDARLAQMEEFIAGLTGQASVSPPGPGAESTAALPEQASSNAPTATLRPGQRPLAANVAALLAKAADLLRVGNGAEFREVEEKLRDFGTSARPTAVLQTGMGSITIMLYPDYAPEAVRNFIELAQGTRPWIDSRERNPLPRGARLYDGTLFHRVVRGLLIQGGDPIGTGLGGPGYRQANEFHDELSFDKPYMVAMALSGESSNGSQFFITVSPAPWFNGKHTIFGEVLGDRAVVDSINQVPVGAADRPTVDVVLQNVRISTATTSDT